MKKTIIIQNETGIHARPAGILAKEAGKFKADIKIEYGDKVANVKSIINLMGLGLKKGSEVTVIAEGEDEREALDSIIKLIENNFEG